MKCSLIPLLPAAAWIVVGGLDVAKGATPLPIWYGTSDSTRQGYFFGSETLTPSPDVLDNPHGTPSATVVTGAFSEGWQDPAAPYDLTGVNLDGAWDLGVAGAITVVCKFAEAPPPPGATFTVEFLVYSVAYLGITSLPTLDTLGLSASDLSYSQALVANDPKFPGATWQGQTWTGSFDGLSTNQLSFRIVAPGNNVSVIDTIEVFTHVTLVPEPSSFLLLIGPVAAWAARRRRH